MPDVSTFNSGSRVLEPLADLVSLPVDKVNIVACLLLGVIVSRVYYHYCAPGKVARETRLFWPMFIGLLMCLFLYGTAYKHVLTMYCVSYALMHIMPINHVHRCVFLFASAYLTWIHYYRWRYLQSMVIDISGPMMLAVQKVTCMAFSLHDGLEKMQKNEEISSLQQREALRRLPTPLEFFSYALTYQTAFVGPLIFYVDYVAFIDGRNAVEADEGKVDGAGGDKAARTYMHCPTSVLVNKITQLLVAVAVVLVLGHYFKHDVVLSDEMWNGPFIPWYFYMWLYLASERFNYYFAWILSDVALNMCGFGFSGLEEDGSEQWELATNVRMFKVELALAWKDVIDNWNITTMQWLRRVAYDRAHQRIRTVCTYLLSAWWHGFFAGYYMLFLTAAMTTSASRRVRRSIRGYFQHDWYSARLYDAITFTTTMIIKPYIGFPFVFIWFELNWRIYKKFYFSGHVVMALAIAILPLVFKQHRSAKEGSPGLRRVDQSTAAFIAEEKVVAHAMRHKQATVGHDKDD